jgi:hypothetical protein
MVSHIQQNSANPWLSGACALTKPNPGYGQSHPTELRSTGTGQPGHTVATEQLWALKPGFQYYALKREKSTDSGFFLSSSTLSIFSHLFFLHGPVLFVGFMLASTKAQRKGRAPTSAR